MSAIIFASICPHPPIILPSIGSKEDRFLAKNTVESIESLGKNLGETNPQKIFITSPHEDWGFNVPLYFLAPDFKGEIIKHLTNEESPTFHFQEGRKIYKENIGGGTSNKIALIASGDLSHCLKEDGPYGFNEQGPEFDKALIEALKIRDVEKILKLDELYPDAGECGLRSVCFILGILEESKINYQPKILSYEWPWGVGYLVVNFKLS